VGLQSHLGAVGAMPGEGLVSFIRECAKLELEVYVTELDVNTAKLPGGPDAQDAAVAKVFHDYLTMVLAEPNVPVALTWGLDSSHSWLNTINRDWAKRPDGSRQRPLPFDDSLNPTPAFWALRAAIDSAHLSAPLSGTAPRPAAIPQANPDTLYQPFSVEGSPSTAPPPRPQQDSPQL
jgi:endo-1,4-beta-xylanase